MIPLCSLECCLLKLIYFCFLSSVEDLRKPVVLKPHIADFWVEQEPHSHSHGLREPHPRPLVLHSPEKNGGSQSPGEDQMFVLQNGRAGTAGRSTFSLCRWRPFLLHYLEGLPFIDIP